MLLNYSNEKIVGGYAVNYLFVLLYTKTYYILYFYNVIKIHNKYELVLKGYY